MVSTTYSYKTANNEKHLVSLLHENRSLEQALDQFEHALEKYLTLPLTTRKITTPSQVRILKSKIPVLRNQLDHVEQAIRGSFKYPSLSCIREISRKHFLSIQFWNEIQQEVQRI